ncbi:UNKNOWN [Stylonychia lemnae]|uniref:Uncharacterized protein n=1 Tax=Stylonychia lemnae TaxID=5949 RepID=A0A078AYI8_STYLE|nr:UNKNOWN [Stylonychia lemnae]|eukprot:CDW85853.1 UNKNOWN [Stylonychia lemnae]
MISFDHEKLKRLVDLVTVVPDANSGHQRGHKFPFIASEIFNCEINSLLDKFFDAPEFKKKEASEHEEEDSEEDKSTNVKEETKDEEEEKKENEAAPSQEQEEEKKQPEEEAVEQKTEEKEQSTPEGEQKEESAETAVATETTDDKEIPPEEEKLKDAEQVEETTSVEAKVEEEIKEPEVKADETKEAEVTELDKEQEQEQTPTAGISQAQPISEPEPEEETKEEEKGGKYLLLERLFKFIRTKETPLNPVLSGYFAKLVTILINRKQKNLIPYVFAPESDVIDCLLHHVQQKSISEILNKFLNIQDHDFESTISAEIKSKQHHVLQSLVEKLSPEATEEDNLNGSAILTDMLDTKEFFNVICQRKHIQRLLDLAFTETENPTASSQNAALQVLNSLIQIYHEKRKDDHRSSNNNDNEDEDTIIQNEDEEGQESPLVEILSQSVSKLIAYLSSPAAAPRQEIDSSYDIKLAPLGHLRLRIIDLIYQLVKLNKASILNSLAETNVFAQISGLVERYPWNNFLQLKVQSLYEEIFENQNADFRGKVLQGSNLAQTLISLSKSKVFEHPSKRGIRHGYMALVVKIANLIQKNKEKQEVQNYLNSLPQPEDWQKFVDGELKSSNDTNSKNLGGQQPRTSMDDDDNEKDYEMNMEKIMAKFTNFNASMSNKSNNENDDEEDDDTEIDRKNSDDQDEEEKKEEDSKESQNQAQESSTSDKQNVQQNEDAPKIIPSEFKEPEPLQGEFADNEFWRPINILEGQSVDDLLADYE